MTTEIRVHMEAEKDTEHKEGVKLLMKAQQGDQKSLDKLIERYGSKPAFWQQVGDLAGVVERRLIESQTGGNLLLQEGIRRNLSTMKAELPGPSPTPLESMLVERITSCWLQVQLAELLCNRSGVSFEQAGHDQKVLDRANKRHLAAIKTLAVVRRLQLPAMQVNIGERQVNVTK